MHISRPYCKACMNDCWWRCKKNRGFFIKIIYILSNEPVKTPFVIDVTLRKNLIPSYCVSLITQSIQSGITLSDVFVLMDQGKMPSYVTRSLSNRYLRPLNPLCPLYAESKYKISEIITLIFISPSKLIECTLVWSALRYKLYGLCHLIRVSATMCNFTCLSCHCVINYYLINFFMSSQGSLLFSEHIFLKSA